MNHKTPEAIAITEKALQVKHTPSFKKDGLIFWPIPDTDDIASAFGFPASKYFNRHKLPSVPNKYTSMAMSLFFNGGKLDLPEDIPSDKAAKFLRALLASFQPSHESKEITAGYALWCWSEECTEARKAIKLSEAL